MRDIFINEETRNRHREIQSRYYDPKAIPQEFFDKIQDASGDLDTLDNILYALLKEYAGSIIAARLKLAAEVHPEEVARRMKAEALGEPEAEDVDEIAEGQWQQLSRKDKAKLLLGG